MLLKKTLFNSSILLQEPHHLILNHATLYKNLATFTKKKTMSEGTYRQTDLNFFVRTPSWADISQCSHGSYTAVLTRCSVPTQSVPL